MQYTAGMTSHPCCMQDRKLAQEGLWAHPTEVPEVGGLLVAHPHAPELLGDPRYWQLVIFLLEHGPRGSRGVILNRPATVKVGDLLQWGLVQAGLHIHACRILDAGALLKLIYNHDVIDPRRRMSRKRPGLRGRSPAARSTWVASTPLIASPASPLPSCMARATWPIAMKYCPASILEVRYA